MSLGNMQPPTVESSQVAESVVSSLTFVPANLCQISASTCEGGIMAPGTDKKKQKKQRKLRCSKPSDFKMSKSVAQRQPKERVESPDISSKVVGTPATDSEFTEL
jgi:hypothetical protein